jgi:hypothetical protein
MKTLVSNEELEKMEQIRKEMDEQLDQLEAEYK